MKKFMYAIMALGILGLSSCNEATKLAQNMEGTWSCTPERFMNDATGSATVIENITYAIDSTGKGGDMIVLALVSTTGQLQGSASIMQPISVSAAAKAEIVGKWQAVDDDEIHVSLDPGTLTVSVDPEGVVLTSNMLDGAAQASVSSIKPQLAESIKTQIANALQMRYASIKKIDDIDIKGNVMEYEINKSDYTASRQIPIVK
ncbi:MAG: hypothetical protein K2O88_04190 [Paramuribaculum sp.]|nr:hypothetical protein [Paramuribaculum sp.]